MLLLNVPYSEKDEAKRLGARWNPDAKRWYVAKREDYPRFARWILNDGFIVACDYIYIVEGRQKCFKCGKETRVIGFGLENYFELEGDSYETEGIGCNFWEGAVRIVSHIEPISAPLLDYIQEHYNYKIRYSSTTGQSNISNCCENCDVLQGDFYLFDEVDSPFFLDSEDKIKELKLYQIPLRNDMILSADIAYSTNDELIKPLANISVLDILK